MLSRARDIEPFEEISNVFIKSYAYRLPDLFTQARLERNPTVKNEIKTKGYRREVSVGFVNYPISQAADITAFGVSLVTVGADQGCELKKFFVVSNC